MARERRGRCLRQGPLTDQDLRGDACPCLLPGPGTLNRQRPAGAQAGDKFALEGAAALVVKGPVDRVLADPHGLIIQEADRKPVRDLLPGSTPSPTPVTAMRRVPPFYAEAFRRSLRKIVEASRPSRRAIAHAQVLSMQQRDVLALDGRHVPTRNRRRRLPIHAASVTELPVAHRCRQPGRLPPRQSGHR